MATIGTIYNKNNFTDLSDFDTKGNWELSAGKIISSGSNSVLQYKRASALDEFQIKVRTTSKFLNIQTYGIKAENNIKTTFSIENGRAKWEFAYDNTSGTSPAAIIIDNGDILEFIITKTQWTVNFQVKNITKNTACDVAAPVAITAHKLRFFASSAVDIISIQKTSNQEFQPLNLLVGDSIAYGSSASIPGNRWGTIAVFSVEGSAGDTSSEALELLYEIINIIRPKRVIYGMGTNDLNIDNWKANLQQFKTIVEQRNIVFIPITPYANSVRNMTAYQAYIAGNFSKFFDLFSVTKQSGNSNMKPEYNSGDNIHPNNAGHLAIGNYVLNSPYYEYEPIISQGNAALYASLFQQWYS
ncbi:hypothetical protein BN1195_03595 [Chryseobacterium oranimense G311]|uniref:hypothetical protein n=1 Tax=Chryseobacterium oranimense TaxID=421058 RepID=UPI000533A0AE|nr:hypothetical protein [Chryseobacterium oranimense]CEJ71250.1 hypothetical protein BN1195_03595 [Chryseobacterium oranimense G311]